MVKTAICCFLSNFFIFIDFCFVKVDPHFAKLKFCTGKMVYVPSIKYNFKIYLNIKIITSSIYTFNGRMM